MIWGSGSGVRVRGQGLGPPVPGICMGRTRAQGRGLPYKHYCTFSFASLGFHVRYGCS